MTETQMRYFMTVADELSFSKAAKKLYVSQPAVSKNISMLEDELGFLLFDRTEKQIRLTEECKLFRGYLKRCLADYTRTMEEIHALRTDFSGVIKIGFVDSWSTTAFYDPIAAYFTENHPNVQLQLNALGVDEMLTALRHSEIDVGITYEFMLSGIKDIVSRPFMDLESGFLYAKGNEAPKQSLLDFKDMFFLLKQEGTEHIRHFITALCEEEGFTPQFLHSKGAGYELTEVRHGKGALFCSQLHFWKESSMFEYFPLHKPLSTRLIYLPSHLSPATKLFVSEVEMLFTDQPAQGHS